MLSPEQIAARKGKLTGTRMKPLMDGDEAAIAQLYRIMVGEELEDDLTWVWPVQRGVNSEALNIRWYQHKFDQSVSRQGDVVNHPFLPWAAVTLDGWIDELKCPLECKDIGGREPPEIIHARYYPQIQWLIEVTCAEQCGLSMIIAGNEPVVDWIPRDPVYAAVMIERGERFMLHHVAKRIPPFDFPAVPPPEMATAVYDMNGNNEWGNAAAIYLETRSAVRLNEDTAKIIKSMVPADSKVCFGNGIYVTTSRNGIHVLREGDPR